MTSFFGVTVAGCDVQEQQEKGRESALEEQSENLECALEDAEEGARPASYALDRINSYLAENPEVQQKLGLSEVNSCDEARDFESIDSSDEEAEEALISENVQPGREDENDDTNNFRIKGHSGIPVGNLGFFKIEGGDTFPCNAVMITRHYALTKASCLRKTGKNRVIGRLRGDGYDIRNQRAEFIRHPRYRRSSDRSHDIALISLPRSLSRATLNRFYAGSTRVGKKLTIYGWGRTGFQNGDDNKLRAGVSDIRLRSHKSGYFTATAATSRICNGDLGGPAVERRGRFRIVWGLADSWDDMNRTLCASRGDDMHWTKTTTSAKWVEDTLKKDSRYGSRFKCATPGASNGGTYYKCF